MPEPSLVVDAIAKHYSGVKALRSVSFTINPGEIVGLIGANGAGKSTLIDVVSGVTRATSGTIALQGSRLRGGSARRARAGLARTFQHPYLAKELTVRETIACATFGPAFRSPLRMAWWAAAGLLGHRPSTARIDDVAAHLGLQGLDRKIETLSFGEMRLTEFACALVQRPRLLMLDEPFPGVAEEGVSGMREALKVARDDGRGVLLVDHNLDIVSSVVDRILLLVDGEIVLEGSVDKCIANPLLRRHYIGVG